jgi:hypothetical protein
MGNLCCDVEDKFYTQYLAPLFILHKGKLLIKQMQNQFRLANHYVRNLGRV